jgi:hypothetical protein
MRHSLSGIRVAESENEIQWRRVGAGKIPPRFRIEVVARVTRQLENLKDQRIELLWWMDPGTEALEILAAYTVHDRLGKNAPRSVAIGQKQHVVATL